MTKVGKGRPDPKVRMGRMMKVLENSPGNPFFKKFEGEKMTFEKFKKLMKRLEESNKKFMK